jgi:hypothetical protein
MKKTKKSDDKDLPGYPHYPDDEDMMRSAEQVPIDVENISRSTNVNTTINESGNPKGAVPEKDLLDETVASSFERDDSDVTEEDIAALGEPGLNIDGGDDEILKNRPYSSIAGDSDLDIPGAELDDANEELGSEDEENNYYSLGGDKD